MKLKSIAFAAGAFCAIAGASAATITINAAGSSASRPIIQQAVVDGVCGAASSITVYHNASNVTRIICALTATSGVGNAGDTLDFNYDNTNGSYSGIGPVSGVGANGGAVTNHLNTASCTTTTTENSGGGKTVASKTGCGNEATLVRPAIGNIDVEPAMFAGANIGANPAPNLAHISQANSQFGVIYGVLVSQALYQALQADQGLAVGSLTNEATAPTLSRAQIASITTANGGPLNTDWTPLFQGTPPAAATSQPVKFVRRVAGSGTQTSFNANFLNYLCSANGVPPAVAANSGGSYVVSEQLSTGNLLAAVNSTSVYSLGIASAENSPAAPGTTTPNWGFIKIDGSYPSKANVQNGRYNWMAEQQLVLRDGTGDANFTNETNLYNKLLALTASPSTIAGFTATVQAGDVALPGVADSSDPQYTAQRTRYRTLGNSCVVPTAVE